VDDRQDTWSEEIHSQARAVFSNHGIEGCEIRDAMTCAVSTKTSERSEERREWSLRNHRISLRSTTEMDRFDRCIIIRTLNEFCRQTKNTELTFLLPRGIGSVMSFVAN
jgi:hypothetical protein